MKSMLPTTARPSRPLPAVALGSWVALLALGAGCGSGRPAGVTTNGPEIRGVHYGRLVDVYGLRRAEAAGSAAIESYQRDVLVAPTLADERPRGSNLPDAEVLYDFLRPDPDTQQPRLLITREIGSSAFLAAFLALGSDLPEIAPAHRAQDPIAAPFPTVPRNAALQITFSRDLGIDLDFFVARDQNGRIVGLKNPDAVQLLEIVPVAGTAAGAGAVGLRRVPVRVVPRRHRLIVDPVLLGTEGPQYGVRQSPTGMPASRDPSTASMRLALPLDGPFALPGLQEPDPGLRDVDARGARSAVRDFRAANDKDRGATAARGFLPDFEPPRLCGDIPMVLAAVGAPDGARQVVTVFKNGRSHDIDRQDVLRFHDPDTGAVLARAEVLEDPEDDRGRPAEAFVRVTIDAVDGLADLDPRRRPDYPQDPALRARWLAGNAPRAVLVAEFSGLRTAPDGTPLPGDDPVNFVRFEPAPLPLDGGEPSPPNQNVSPFALAVVRFSEPLELRSVRSLDSLFFATRDLFDRDAIEAGFVEPRGIDPARFNEAKFRTPHLVGSRVVDETGSQTRFRLEPLLGFYLDDEMRRRDSGRPFEEQELRYYFHLLGGPDGLRDLAGNLLDLDGGVAETSLVVPFALDLRRQPNGAPRTPDNRVVYLARRLADPDEDEQPSLYRREEAPGTASSRAGSFPLPDLFGAVSHLADGRLLARPTSRVTRVVDDLNQLPAPPQASYLRHCPEPFAGGPQSAFPSASVPFGAPLANPLNRAGARMQAVWREIDLGLSRSDPHDFDLDVEQMYWAPFTGGPVHFEEYARTSLYLGHSERRPEPCGDRYVGLASMPTSGLGVVFDDNYAHDLDPAGQKEHAPAPHPAYLDATLSVDASQAITEPHGIRRYLPLPAFQAPYLVWRDQTLAVQGGNSGQGADVRGGYQSYAPYIVSPWLAGAGRLVTGGAGGWPEFHRGSWGNSEEFWMQQTSRRDLLTGGGLGSIALGLLADFWTWPDTAGTGSDGGARGTPPDSPRYRGPGDVSLPGQNGWQVSLGMVSAPTPAFRALSSGNLGAGTPVTIDPASAAWTFAQGGYDPSGQRTLPADNTVLWVMVDFLKRRTVATAGFADLLDPHRMPPRNPGEGDPRLGPYAVGCPPAGIVRDFAWAIETPVGVVEPGAARGQGAQVAVEFRAASRVDDEPWRWHALGLPEEQKPDPTNFPLDPFKACDAHIRKFDDRPVGDPPEPRLYWARYYNRQVTDYTSDVQQLVDPRFLARFRGPHESFAPCDVRYVNWRFILDNDVSVSPPRTASIESFALAYRLAVQ